MLCHKFGLVIDVLRTDAHLDLLADVRIQLSVTVLSQNRLLYIWPGQIVREQFIDNQGDIFKNIAVVNPFMIESGG